MARTPFEPRTFALTVTRNFVAQNIPSDVRFVRFVSVDGPVGIRINNTGNNYMELNPGFASFEIPIRDTSSVEIIGAAGGEVLRGYIR